MDRLTIEQRELRSHFAEGLLPLARSWDEARRAFVQAQATAPNDGPRLTFLAPIDAFVVAPPRMELGRLLAAGSE